VNDGGRADDLYVLAFDHRRSLMTSLLGVHGDPSPGDVERARDIKRLIWGGLQRALEMGASRKRAGALVDLTYGGSVAVEARASRVAVAVPIEASGRTEFGLERDDWRAVLEDVDPTWAKVLVRYNPEGDAAMNARQRWALAGVSDHLGKVGRGFMFELLVPPDAAQLARVDLDHALYDRHVRPGLMVRAIDELQRSGIEPDIWKIEGLERREDCVAVAEQVRAAGRAARCVVLGRGQDAHAVDAWLRAAAPVPGFAGFAIGRSIWWGAAREYIESAGPDHGGTGDEELLDRATSWIAERYRRFVDVYTGRA
jgi:myo-inositol catabolism protein IolC